MSFPVLSSSYWECPTQPNHLLIRCLCFSNFSRILEQPFSTENTLLRFHTLAILRSGCIEPRTREDAIKVGSFMDNHAFPVSLTLCRGMGGSMLVIENMQNRQRVSFVSLLAEGKWRIHNLSAPITLHVGRENGAAMLENVQLYIKNRRNYGSFIVIRHWKEHCKRFTPVYEVFTEDCKTLSVG